jgi:hypothetical protein
MATAYLSSCSTVAVFPATVNVPFRGLSGFCAMLNVTVPLPVPLAPDVIVIHDTLLTAVHVHGLVVETVTVPVVAALPTF